jgi:hypothetical protein
MHRGHLCCEFTLQRFDATPLGQERNFFRRPLRRSGAIQVRFDLDCHGNALRNVKGILNYAVWGVPLGNVDEGGRGAGQKRSARACATPEGEAA